MRLRRPARAGRKAARPRPQRRTGAASCPSCGAPVKFRNRRSVARVCEYCDTTLVRDDAGDALRELGKVSHLVADASPLRIGATGTCFGVGFSVLGRLQIEHETGLWNEWFLEWADGHTGWLGEALGQYLITFPARGEGIRTFVPLFDELSVGQRVVIDGKRYTVTELRKALATGTEGETPFVVEEGYELPYADLRRGSDGFGTIDYSEDPPLVFTGRCVSWPDLNLRGYRSFDGWQG
ncbi:MAG: DUF4178 domain-containing protein [Planctomycetota bacterium]|nr:MAG: DUF4178 domain-containing protein [Planctomycetota bacterium]